MYLIFILIVVILFIYIYKRKYNNNLSRNSHVLNIEIKTDINNLIEIGSNDLGLKKWSQQIDLYNLLLETEDLKYTDEKYKVKKKYWEENIDFMLSTVQLLLNKDNYILKTTYIKYSEKWTEIKENIGFDILYNDANSLLDIRIPLIISDEGSSILFTINIDQIWVVRVFLIEKVFFASNMLYKNLWLYNLLDSKLEIRDTINFDWYSIKLEENKNTIVEYNSSLWVEENRYIYMSSKTS